MERWSAALKGLGWVVVVLMVLAIVYAAAISLWHWSGIAV